MTKSVFCKGFTLFVATDVLHKAANGSGWADDGVMEPDVTVGHGFHRSTFSLGLNDHTYWSHKFAVGLAIWYMRIFI